MIVLPAVTANEVRHGVLIKLLINGTYYYISNTYGPTTYLGDNYVGLGHFLGTNEIQDDLKTTNNQIQVSLSGIPKSTGEAGLGSYSSYVQLILEQKIKGSKIWIYRAFFDLSTNELLTNSTSLRFSGYISNFSITDGIDLEARQNTKTCVISCSSVNGILERQISGRRTNRTDQRALYPSDSGMDRVAAISNTTFDFGKPYTGGTGGGSGSGGISSGDSTQAG